MYKPVTNVTLHENDVADDLVLTFCLILEAKIVTMVAKSSTALKSDGFSLFNFIYCFFFYLY